MKLESQIVTRRCQGPADPVRFARTAATVPIFAICTLSGTVVLVFSLALVVSLFVLLVCSIRATMILNRICWSSENKAGMLGVTCGSTFGFAFLSVNRAMGGCRIIRAFGVIHLLFGSNRPYRGRDP